MIIDYRYCITNNAKRDYIYFSCTPLSHWPSFWLNLFSLSLFYTLNFDIECTRWKYILWYLSINLDRYWRKVIWFEYFINIRVEGGGTYICFELFYFQNILYSSIYILYPLFGHSYDECISFVVNPIKRGGGIYAPPNGKSR